MHYYIKNGKPFQSETPVYFFEWTCGGGSTTFGMHGTEEEYNKDCEKRASDYNEVRTLVTKRAVPEITDQHYNKLTSPKV